MSVGESLRRSLVLLVVPLTLASCEGWQRDPVKSFLVMGATLPLWAPAAIVDGQLREARYVASLPPPTLQRIASVSYLGGFEAGFRVQGVALRDDGALAVRDTASVATPATRSEQPSLRRLCDPGRHSATFVADGTGRRAARRAVGNLNAPSEMIVADWSTPGTVTISLWRTAAQLTLPLPVAADAGVRVLGGAAFLVCADPGRAMLLLRDAEHPNRMDAIEVRLGAATEAASPGL